MACTFCKTILTDYTIKHTPEACPLRASLMCTYCNKTGHSNSLCAYVKKATLPTVQPAMANRRTTHFAPAIDIRTDDRSICAYLRAQGQQPSQKPKKNIELLNAIAAEQGFLVKKKIPL